MDDRERRIRAAHERYEAERRAAQAEFDEVQELYVAAQHKRRERLDAASEVYMAEVRAAYQTGQGTDVPAPVGANG